MNTTLSDIGTAILLVVVASGLFVDQTLVS
jgi:hypothetical protein